MSKNGRTLWLLTCILVILLVLLAGLKLFNSVQEEKKAQEEKAARIHITELSDLKRISYNNDTEDITVVKKDGKWVLENDPKVELQQSYFNTLEDELSDLIAEREVTEPDDLKDYGLDQPVYTIDASDEDGSEIKVYVGNGADSEYYLTVDDKVKVYTGGSALVSALQYEIGDMIVNDKIPTIGTEQVIKISIQTPEGKSSYKGNDDAVAVILGGLGSLSFDGCINYHVKDSELDEYGLDKEHRTAVSITYKKTAEDEESEQETFTLYIGNTDETDTYYYVQVKGSKIINKALVNTGNNLMNKSND